MHYRTSLQDFVNQFFSHHPQGIPLTDGDRQMIEHSILGMVHRAIRLRRPLSRVDEYIRAMAAQFSTGATDVSEVDETDVIENICQLILECAVSEITNAVPAEILVADTVEC